MMMSLNVDPNHPYARLPHLWQGSFDPPPLADPDDAFRVLRTHLNKDDIGKSSGSCKASLVTRLHRSTVMQEIWCASYEEMEVNICLAGHPMVVNIMEQYSKVPFVDLNGKPTHTRVDSHLLLKDGAEVLVSVKYPEKARRPSYLAEVANIAKQCDRVVADRFAVASRFSFHPVHRDNAKKVHVARRGWDPEADRIVLEAANDFGARFTLFELIDASKLEDGRGYRAAVRLMGDGDIERDLFDPIEDELVCWSAAA